MVRALRPNERRIVAKRKGRKSPLAGAFGVGVVDSVKVEDLEEREERNRRLDLMGRTLLGRQTRGTKPHGSSAYPPTQGTKQNAAGICVQARAAPQLSRACE